MISELNGSSIDQDLARKLYYCTVPPVRNGFEDVLSKLLRSKKTLQNFPFLSLSLVSVSTA